MSDTANTAAPVEASPTNQPAPTEGTSGEPTPAAPAKVDAPVKSEPQAPHLARIKKEEARLRAERDAVKKEREEWEKSKGDREADAKLRTSDPLKWIEKQGWSYAQLTEMAITGKPPESAQEEPVHPEVARVKEELAALKAERDKERSDAAKQEDERQASAYHERVLSEVKAAGEKYELVNADPHGLDTVWSLIQEHAAATGEVLSPDEAAAKVEAALEEQLETRWKPVLTSKKGSARLSTVGPKRDAPEAASESGPSRAVPRTLSSSLAAPAPPSAKQRPLSRQELAERAAAELDARKRSRPS